MPHSKTQSHLNFSNQNSSSSQKKQLLQQQTQTFKPNLQNIISGYLVFDIVVMLYSNNSTKEFFIYLILLGGTLLDLIMLNDIYIFNNYSSQIGNGIVLGQFINTCFLTVLVSFRLFRLFNVSKKFYQNIKSQNTFCSSSNSNTHYRNEQSKKIQMSDNSSKPLAVSGQNLTQNNFNGQTQLATKQQQSIKVNQSDDQTQDKQNMLSLSSDNKVKETQYNNKNPNSEQLNNYHNNNSSTDSLQMKAQIPQINNFENNKITTSSTSKQQQDQKSQIANLINSDHITYQYQLNSINSNGLLDQNSQKIQYKKSEITIHTQETSLEKINQLQINNNKEQNLNNIIISSPTEENPASINSQMSEDKNCMLLSNVTNQLVNEQRSSQSPLKEQKTNNRTQKKQGKSKQHKNKNLHSLHQSNTTLNQNSCENISKSMNDLPTSSISQIQDTQYEKEPISLDSFKSNNNIIQTSDKQLEIHSTSVLEIISQRSEKSEILNARNKKEESIRKSSNPKNIQSNLKNERMQNKEKNNKVQSSNKKEQNTEELQNNDTKCNQNIEENQQIENKQNVNVEKKQINIQVKQDEITIVSLNNLSTQDSQNVVQDPSELNRMTEDNENKQKQESQKQLEIQINQQQNSLNTINSDYKIQTQTVEQNPLKSQEISDILKNEQSDKDIFYSCQDFSNSHSLNGVNMTNKSYQQFQDSKSENIDVNYSHSIQSQTVYASIINLDIDDQEQQVIKQATTSPSLREILSSLRESHDENSSLNSSPKQHYTQDFNVLNIQNNINNQQQLNLNTEAATSGSNQNKSTSKFSCDQDEESSSEENNEKDQHFLEQSAQKNTTTIVVSSTSLSQQSLHNSQRRLSEPKNKANRKNIQQKNQNINNNTDNKTPIESPSQIQSKDLTINSTFQEAQKIIQEEDNEMQQYQESTEINDNTQNIYQVEQNSFQLDPQNNSDLSNTKKNKIEREKLSKKDSWESASEIQQNDTINYFANPLLEALSKPYRSPGFYASSPKRENNSLVFNGLLYQQLGNWNESLQLNSVTPPTQEQLKTSSNTLSPKYPSKHQASSDNQNDEVKQRKSTHFYSEELVSDIEKLNQPPTWKITSGEEENSSYEEYSENLQRVQQEKNNDQNLEQNHEDAQSIKSQSSSQKNMNSSQQLNKKKQETSLFKPLIEKTEFNQTQNNIFSNYLNKYNKLIQINNGQQVQFENKGMKFDNVLTQNSQNVLGQDEVITNSELNNSLLKSETNVQEYEQSISPIQENKDFNQPLIIEIKGENNKVFEVVIENLSDIGILFDQECSKNGVNPEDILASKITILTNLIQQSLDDQDNKLQKQLTFLLNELTLEHTLKSYSDIMTTEQQEQLAKIICNQTYQNESDDEQSSQGQNNYYNMYYNFGYDLAYPQSSSNWFNMPSLLSNQNFSPPIYMNPHSSQQKYQDFGDQIQLPEFNVNANEIDSSHYIDGYLNNSNNTFGNGLFNNYIDFSRNSFQQSMGNMSPLFPNNSKPMSKKQKIQSRINGMSQISNQGNINSAVDMDYFGSENKLDNNNMREIETQKQQSNHFINLTAQQSSTAAFQSNIKSDMHLESPPINNFMMFGNQQFVLQNPSVRKSIPTANPHNQFANRSSQHFPSSHNFGNMASSSHNFGNIASSTFGDQYNASSAQRIRQLIPEPTACDNNSNSSGVKDQWKFNPSSITSTPLLQPIIKPKNQTESMPLNLPRKNQSVWYNNSPQNPYLLDTPTPNLLNKTTSTMNNQPSLFQSDLLAQLAQLGQPIK